MADRMFQPEKFNTLSHLVGALLALAGTVVLIVFASQEADPWKITSVSVYGATLILLYLISTLYHGIQGRAKAFLRELDHQSIYLLIAGSYTPFCLVTLRDSWGWSLLGVVWGLAVLGIWIERRQIGGSRIPSLTIYVLMGWTALAALFPLVRALGTTGFIWLTIGGLLYTVGIVFYVLGKRLAFSHGIWHLFVIAGSATHFFVIFHYVL